MAGKPPTTRDAPAKVLPTKPSSRGGVGRRHPQRRDLTHTDEPDLIPLYSFEEAGQPIRGPTTEQDEQLGAAQTDDEDSAQGGAAHPMDVRGRALRPLHLRCPAPAAAALPNGCPVQTTDGVPAPRQRRIWT